MAEKSDPSQSAASTVNLSEPDLPELDIPRFRALMKASFIAIGVDLFLILFKYVLAKISGSAVLLADALHSGGDLAVSLTVLISIIVNYSFSDSKWAKKAEAFTALLISSLLMAGSLRMIWQFLTDAPGIFLLTPGIPLVIAFAGISVVIGITFKMSLYKKKIGKTYDSIAFSAEGDHTFSDFLTTFGVWITLLLGYFSIHIERAMALGIGFIVFYIGARLFLNALQLFKFKLTFFSRFSFIFPESFFAGIRKLRERIARLYAMVTKKLYFPVDLLSGKKRQVIWLNIILILLLYAGTGFYKVQPCQTGVELLFGKVVEQNLPGPHYHFPAPFGGVIRVDTGVLARLESGFRTDINFTGVEPEVYLWEYTHKGGKYVKVPEEAMTLTGDENFADVNFLCYYRITDPVTYALNCQDAHETLRSLFTHKIHSTIGHYSLDMLLTSARNKVQEELFFKMKKAVEGLPLGVDIKNVYMQEAHPPLDVIRQYRAVSSARETKDKIIHLANAYANNQLPRSKGEAEAMLLKANAYALEKVLVAKGEAVNFSLKHRSFDQYDVVHKIRLWWETVEKVYKDKTVYILPGKANRRVYTSDIPYTPAKKDREGKK